MRWLASTGVLLFALGVLVAQDAAARLERRYNIDVNLEKYPQKTPQETLKSLLTAASTRKLPYLMAHLADPAYVDAKVNDYTAIYRQGPLAARALVAFERLVEEVDRHFRNDPSLLAELRRCVKEGEWDVGDNTASVKLPNIVGRKAFFKKSGERWFLENRQE